LQVLTPPVALVRFQELEDTLGAHITYVRTRKHPLLKTHADTRASRSNARCTFTHLRVLVRLHTWTEAGSFDAVDL